METIALLVLLNTFKTDSTEIMYNVLPNFIEVAVFRKSETDSVRAKLKDGAIPIDLQRFERTKQNGFRRID